MGEPFINEYVFRKATLDAAISAVLNLLSLKNNVFLSQNFDHSINANVV